MSTRPVYGFSPAALEKAMQARNLTPTELARLARVNTHTLWEWRTGRATPRVGTLAQVGNALGVPVGALMDIAPDRRCLADLRTMHGLSQIQLATIVGISFSVLSDVERGRTRLRPELAARIAKALKRSPREVREAVERARRGQVAR